jgi:muconolactone delta-isomerase
MEYLVTMTTHVPDGTPAEAVDGAAAAARRGCHERDRSPPARLSAWQPGALGWPR